MCFILFLPFYCLNDQEKKMGKCRIHLSGSMEFESDPNSTEILKHYTNFMNVKNMENTADAH